MDNDSVVEQIVKSLSFEVVAVPQDNVLQLTTTTKVAPLNVKIRVRKKEEAAFRNGVISLPKPNRPDDAPERVRLVSSDQTIMSFNVVMEADFQKPTKKPRRFWGIFKPNHNATSAARKNKTFFGRCKPGGCLDPPFGEDRLPYSPAIVDEQTPCGNSKGQGRASSILSNQLFHKKKKSNDSETLNNKVMQNENKTESVIDLYQAESQKPYSTNSILTYPPTLNSSELQEEKRASRIYTDPSKNSFNEHSGSYFMIPKKQKNVLDKNSIIKDENDSNIWDSKFSENLNINSKDKNIDVENNAPSTKNSVTEMYLTESSFSNDLKEKNPVESSISDKADCTVPIPIPMPIITPAKQNVEDKESQDKDLITTKRNSKSNNVLKNYKSLTDANIDDVFQSDEIVSKKKENSISKQIMSENKPEDKSVITIDANHQSSNLDLTKSSLEDERKSSVKNIENQGFIEIPTPIIQDDLSKKIKSQNNSLQHLWKNKNDPIASDLKLQKQNELGKPVDKKIDMLHESDGKESYEQISNTSFSNLDDKIRENKNNPMASDLKLQKQNELDKPIIKKIDMLHEDDGKEIYEQISNTSFSNLDDKIRQNKNNPMASDLKLQKQNELDKPIIKKIDMLHEDDGKEIYEQISNTSFSNLDDKIRENKNNPMASDLKLQKQNELDKPIIKKIDMLHEDDGKEIYERISNKSFSNLDDKIRQNKNDSMASDLKLQKQNELGKPVDKNIDMIHENDGKEIYEQISNDSFSNLDDKIREKASKDNDLKSQSENFVVNDLDLLKEVRTIPESIKKNDDLIFTDKNDSIEVPKVSSNSLIESGQKTITNSDDLQITKPFTFQNDEIIKKDLQKSDAETVIFLEDKDKKESISNSRTNSEKDLLPNALDISTESKKYDEENNKSLGVYITEYKTELDNNSKASSERDSYTHYIEDQIKSTKDEYLTDNLNINDPFNSLQTKDSEENVQDTENYASESKLDTARDGEASHEQNPLTKITEEIIEPTENDEAINKHGPPYITDKTQGILKDSALTESNDKIPSPSSVDTSKQEESQYQNKASDKHIKFDTGIKIESKITKTSPEIEASKKGLSDENILSQPRETTLSNKATPILVNFAVHSHIDNMNQKIVKSLDADNLPKRYSPDSVNVTKQYLNTDEEINLPIDSENNLCIQIKRNKQNKDKKNSYNEDKGITETPIVGNNRQHMNESDPIKRNVITAEGLQKTLEGVYIKELLPLRNNISELKDNIEMLTQHMVLNGHMFVRKSRSTKIIPMFKKCSCTRK